ncbi:hypothetical protein DACRYDRAFT_104387 [Dacryopinax primogenitus]|uniref:Uncharacterized protein n=1 Tax=Dacryopinax primogenitus (strain DJM 731) TaxID=1858805 RepID=M5G6L6_DACPD|nr:uncharacterized protein DACRYDRAFT_104387 [Dacryopinax primogenitus]EJU05896.1 hypothetical protein DACRYDRAFT_104387 [Dacryopinax primogenitus]
MSRQLQGRCTFCGWGYDKIVKVFETLNVDFFYLEYDTPRARSFELLQFYPRNKAVVLGLVSTKNAQVEDRDYIMTRLEEAARCLGDTKKERISISP